MGKRIIAQRRGKGSSVYRAYSHRHLAEIKYRDKINTNNQATIIDILNDTGRNAPVAELRFPDNTKTYTLASESSKTKDNISIGKDAGIKPGNIVPIGKIPEGTPIFNIEIRPNDGGKLVRSSGTYAIVSSHDVDKTVIKLPSKQFKSLNHACRATIGITAGGELKSKPFVKAGTRWHTMHKRGKLYPRTSARSMNAVDHKFGGSNLGVAKTVSRNAPPGRKVGTIASKRTGRKR
ncbi:MAG: 50S ribosomal protein L2 [archaeon]